MRLLTLLIFTLIALAPARAQDAVTATPERITQILQDLGYRAQIDEDSYGDPLIISAAEGVDFRVVFYNCEDGECGSIGFSAGFDLASASTATAMNEWNRGKRFARGFIDDEGDPFLVMDLDLEHGMDDEAFKGNLALWANLLSDFQTHIDW